MKHVAIVLLASALAGCAPEAKPANDADQISTDTTQDNGSDAATLENTADNLEAAADNAAMAADNAADAAAPATTGNPTMEPTDARTKPDKPILVNSM